MDHTSSHEIHVNLNRDEQLKLLSIARQSISHGLKHHAPLPLQMQSLPPALQEILASFVTLTLRGHLRGCIGMLEAHYPLAIDVSNNAFSAAFRDPRFPPLSEEEWTEIKIEISILSIPEPLPIQSEQDLLEKMRPGVDGLILEEGFNRGTFLPAVWEDLPEAEDFLRHLKLKAGLPVDYWSDTLKVSRYTADKISE